mmetsp:Transcript_49888/g.131866  ORF Transcript_49888/g.131866 Transcript_49888/m.131866 type:complete len:487 (+) Transcript_49888:112-1572(+)
MMTPPYGRAHHGRRGGRKLTQRGPPPYCVGEDGGGRNARGACSPDQSRFRRAAMRAMACGAVNYRAGGCAEECLAADEEGRRQRGRERQGGQARRFCRARRLLGRRTSRRRRLRRRARAVLDVLTSPTTARLPRRLLGRLARRLRRGRGGGGRGGGGGGGGGRGGRGGCGARILCGRGRGRGRGGRLDLDREPGRRRRRSARAAHLMMNRDGEVRCGSPPGAGGGQPAPALRGPLGGGPEAVEVAALVQRAPVGALLRALDEAVVQRGVAAELVAARDLLVEGRPEVLGVHLAFGRGAGRDEAEVLAQAEVVGVPHGEPEDVVRGPHAAANVQVPGEEAAVEALEGRHGGPGRAVFQAGLQAARHRARPPRLADPQDVVSPARDLLHLVAGRPHGRGHDAILLPAGGGRESAAALVAGAGVELQVRVEVRVKVPREREALTVGGRGVPHEGVHEGLAAGDFVERAPPEGHAREDACHRHRPEAQAV